MASLPTNPIMITLLAIISTVLGCGVNACWSRAFTVTGFNNFNPLPWFTLAINAVRAPDIATNMASDSGFVQRLVVQTVFDVLERQARSALLPDALIPTILGELTVENNFTPIDCPMITDPEEMRELSN
ncbi:hypothetical protein KIN20_002513 [Parelaphostrongylus tenuis]|uniref:Uncharacterized protein n=1 Tax=Parelaphostrongylus tenuis TaxID=148309 RepID=A0AAD5QDL0_PARTN|nr:hypothetical protein KIN20_002513 [Parelaphostrongylus tenuis]